VVAAAQVILALQAEHERLQALPIRSDLGPPSLTVTIAHGGTGINVVPDSCVVALDRRIIDGEDASQICISLCELASSTSPLPLTVDIQKEINAFYQAPDSALVRQLTAWSGNAPTVAPYGTNAWAYVDTVDSCVVFGPGSIAQAHGAEEWVAITELEKAAAIYSQWWGIE
jgi:acetylornithine deacetylase